MRKLLVIAIAALMAVSALSYYVGTRIGVQNVITGASFYLVEDDADEVPDGWCAERRMIIYLDGNQYKNSVWEVEEFEK